MALDGGGGGFLELVVFMYEGRSEGFGFNGGLFFGGESLRVLAFK